MNNSFWNNILTHSPPPERDEIALLVGRSLLSINQNLWEEKIALQEISKDMSSISTNKASPFKKMPGRNVFRDAMSYSKIHYNEGDSNDYEHENDSGDLWNTSYFDEEFVLKKVETIQIIIQKENEELEIAIEELRNTLNNDDDEDDEMFSLTQAPVKSGGSNSRSNTATTTSRVSIDLDHLHIASNTPQSSSSSRAVVPADPKLSSSCSTTSRGQPRKPSSYSNSAVPSSSTTTSSIGASHKRLPSKPLSSSTTPSTPSSNRNNNSGSSSSTTRPSSSSLATVFQQPSITTTADNKISQHNNNRSPSNTDINNNNNSNQTASPPPTSNRFRARLRDAQAELYLTDDI